MLSGELLDGRYLLESRIGIGGMGEVWRAHDVEVGRVVAIKRLHDHLAERSLFVARFLREARAAMKTCISPHIIEVSDVVCRQGAVPYLVMEYLEGETLSQVLHRRGSLPIPMALDIALQTCCALAEVHLWGVIHRDIKPANLFITRTRNNKRFIKILDFGVAKLKETADDDGLSLTGTGVVIGTVEYMPLEQIFGSRDLDHRVDIYAMGKVLYHMLAGQRPPPEPEDLVEEAPLDGLRIPCLLRSSRPDVDERLESVVYTAMARERDKRFASMDEMSNALEACLVQTPCSLQCDEEDTHVTPPPPECVALEWEEMLYEPTTLDNVYKHESPDSVTSALSCLDGDKGFPDTERHSITFAELTTPDIL